MNKITISVPNVELCNYLAKHFNREQVAIYMWDMKSEPPVTKFDMVVAPYLDGPNILSALEGVNTKLLQWQSIGYDGVSDYLPVGVQFANAASVHETATAELAVGLAIAAQRDLKTFFRAQEQSTWQPGTTRALADRRVTVVGNGGVGRAVCERLAPFEVQLTRVANSARTETLPSGETVQVYSADQLDEILINTDILILTVPLTATTEHLINAEKLKLLPDAALLVNVARGKVVDTRALVAELTSGRLRAALDVIDPEPLPESHPLWQLENVLITPHTGGDADSMMPRLHALLRRQITALLRDEQPENIVDCIK
ncbi:2-hydroxyacid dehydrogenase [Canibacter sp. lx-72]|uniref:2-hydroxyacid dehydrogenase n=1 Tax=Canibacter zhuwentaonis TaxID=2837491 RepID=UPI001BDD5D13|nr:2-hydroxyacid dehydrogenase [Canibacter zhuwentaonis]MBT1018690.1 2-hydroxyacid dehydrogenase [Canibacter zhuwentaonis]